MARLPVVVSDDQKQRWEEYANSQPEYDSASDLVRKSVEQEIQSQKGGETGIREDDWQRFSDLFSLLQNNQNDLERNIKALHHDSITEEEFETLVKADIQPIIEHTVNEQVRRGISEYLDQSLIRPTLRRREEITYNKLIDMNKEEIIEFIFEE